MEQVKVMTANATIYVGQIVKLDTTRGNCVLPCGANGRAFGIAQPGSRAAPIPDVTDSPAIAALAGETLEVYVLGKVCQVRAGGTLTAGSPLKSDASGLAVVTAETTGLKEFSVGIALTPAVVNEWADVFVMPQVIYTP